MAECGASGSGSSGDSLDKSITLPPDEIFRNLENAKRFAIDIGRRGLAQGEGRRGQAWVRAAGPEGRGGGKDEGRGAGRWCRTACRALWSTTAGAYSLSVLVVCGLPARAPLPLHAP